METTGEPTLAPGAIRFEAMTVGALLDKMFRLYGQNFTLMLGIVAVSYVPVYLLQLGAIGVAFQVGGQEGALLQSVGVLVSMLLAWLVAYPLAEGAAMYAVSERYLGRVVSIGQAYAQARKRWGTILNTQISVGLRVGLGCLLLIVPGILWALSYAVAVPVVMLEGTKATASMSRSRELTRGHRRKVFNVMFMVGVLGLLTGVSISLLVMQFFDLQTAAGVMVQNVATDLGTLLIMPLGIIGPILLYYDFRIRKEGFDLEMLGRALAEQTAPPA